VVRRLMCTLVLTAALMPAQTVAADSGDTGSIIDQCPVPLGRYVYDSEHISYKVRVYLDGCSWYDGQPVVLRGALKRSDGITQGEATVALRCQPEAPPPGPDPDDHTGHNSVIPYVPLAAQAGGAGQQADEVRPASDCVLAVRMPHLPVERAHYEGQLTYPVQEGEFTERISLDCLSAHDVIYKCSRPGEPPVSPER
jgi:hypothetical protein